MAKVDSRIINALRILEVIEALYLLTFVFVLYAANVPNGPSFESSEAWLLVSYMLLPILLLKNIIVALYNNGTLSNGAKAWLMVRCALYILLTLYAYPLVVSLTT